MSEYVKIANLKDYAEQEVSLRGWLEGSRSSGKLIFLLVRDGSGSCQCVVEAAAEAAFETATQLTRESSLELVGKVRLDERAPGGAEISVTAITPMQIAEEYPISRKSHGVDFLMNHRHLWLRSRRQTNILKIRDTIIRTIEDFFASEGFIRLDTPILTPDAAEGAGTLFGLDYFGEQAYLTQTGQLYLESAAMALEKVYCFGPTFRAEKSKTRRHLTEFWMVEPEVAFAELPDLLALAESMISRIVSSVLSVNRKELEEIGRDIEPLEQITPPFPRITYSEAVEMLHSNDMREKLEAKMERDRETLEEWQTELKQLEQRLEQVSNKGKKAGIESQADELRESIEGMEKNLENRPDHINDARNFEWGKDLGGDEETIISNQFERPVFITEYPRDAKAFYMKRNNRDPRVVLNMDMLAPEGYGEIIGGSQREDDIEILTENIEREGLDPRNYKWYLDLRRYGSVPHGGYGLGIERTVAWICGLHHVRETIPFPRLMGRLHP